MRRALTVAVVALVGAGVVAVRTQDPGPARRTIPPAAGTTVPGTTATAHTPAAEPPPASSALPLPLPGCPPPPPSARPQPPVNTWRPPVLVPEAALPAAPAPPGNRPPADLSPLDGKGVWLWKYFQSESGDAAAIVTRARAAGLSQLWVRVGDSRDGFYAAEVLDALVPRAHAAGLSVLGWGFPYLHDPVDDARWSADALAWRGPGGEMLDGFSPDLERAAEGVVMTARRASLYLGLVRQAAADRLVVATVYRPTDRLWNGAYPYASMAPYVDAFAPMVYWGCEEPGAAAGQSLQRLGELRPVHVIGQAYDMAAEGGRTGHPPPVETRRFLDVARRQGAVGASFWVWQAMGPEQWESVAGFPWEEVPRGE